MKSRMIVSLIILCVLFSIVPDAYGARPASPVLSFVSKTYTTVSFSWTQPAGDPVDDYFAQINTPGPGGFVTVATLLPTQFTYTFIGLTPNTAYDFRIRACNSDGCRNSNVITVTTLALTVPNPPVLSETGHGQTTIDLSWTTPTDGGSAITSYTLQRSINSFLSIDDSSVIGFGTNVYSDSGLSPNTLYEYRVRATNAIGNSGFSNIVQVTTDPAPPVDVTPPVLTILGSNPLNHTINTPYIDAGATAIDDFDGDITVNIIITNGVNENVLGTYLVNYFIEDLAGNNSTADRTVNVVNTIIIPPPPPSTNSTTQGGDSCRDCVAPTLGVDEDNKERVNEGFTYKNGFFVDNFFVPVSRGFTGQTVNVNYFRTPFPAIGTEVGINNTLILKIYEDSGVNNIRHVAVGFGLNKNGEFSESKAYIEVDRDFKTNVSIKTFGAVQNVTYTTNIVPCGIIRADCLEFTLYHTFTEDVSGVVGTFIWDNKLNSQQNYFNDGIIVKDNKVVIKEPEPVKIDKDKLKGVSSFGYFQRGTYAFENYKQSQADEAKEFFNSLYGKINNWD